MKSKKKYHNRSAMQAALHDMAKDNQLKREQGEDVPGIAFDLLKSKKTTKLNKDLGLHRLNMSRK